MSSALPPETDEPNFTPEAMQKLVAHLWNARKNPQAGSALLYTVLGAFAGLRPAEATELDWKAFDWTERRLKLLTGAANVERIVPMQENFFQFMQPYQNRKGLVVIHKKVAMILREYCKEAGVPHIPNGLRRSYTAYRLTETPLEIVQAETGMDEAMLKAKFPTPPSVEVARQYWAIQP